MIERETTSTFNKLTGSPRKRFYRARAHSNPLKIQFADIGCGFGGQLVALSTLFPDKLTIEEWQLTKTFFPFPDPHFKEKNEYAYTLAVGGIIYTITDVEELGEWMKGYLENHPMFEALTEEELMNDPVVKLLTRATEEGQKVARISGKKFNLHWLQSFDKVFIAFKFSCCNFLGACIFYFRSH
ncbi:hypothetical protein ACJRO7_033840 [Eucalyptus globulus]|uniref:tRNA (guanine(46)-N(7))-methyltransferase n=1 Tax=Eucalyptus globulus TaxID=34317 RepID=A0ABD3J4L3_EUCGL